MWFKTSALVSLLPALAAAAPVDSSSSSAQPRIDYDAIVVGGGPSGLSAASGLARVRRSVLLVDSGVYRNGVTRHMHDVIGFDGVTPAYYRFAAREQIAQYGTASLTNGTITKIQPESNNTYFTVTGTYGDNKEVSYTARKVVLATGIKDLLPDTPGLKENWGQGIYWCPWCDGHEHADQGLGIIGPLTSFPTTVREVISLNKDIIGFTNGTDSPDARNKTEAKFPQWQDYLKLKNIPIEDRQITQIERLQNGSDPNADPSLPSHPEHDVFRVHFDKGDPIVRNAFLTNFDSEQYSKLGEETGVALYGGRLAADGSKGLATNVLGVYAIGDANSDNVTNVPHAIFSGKRTAVYLHVQLEREASERELKALNKTSSSIASRDVHERARSFWDLVTGKPGEVLYAGKFDQ